MALLLDLLQDLKNLVIIRDAIGVEATAVRQTLELPSAHRPRGGCDIGQRLTDDLLVRLRQTPHQFNHMLRCSAHKPKLSEPVAPDKAKSVAQTSSCLLFPNAAAPFPRFGDRVSGVGRRGPETQVSGFIPHPSGGSVVQQPLLPRNPTPGAQRITPSRDPVSLLAME